MALVLVTFIVVSLLSGMIESVVMILVLVTVLVSVMIFVSGILIGGWTILGDSFDIGIYFGYFSSIVYHHRNDINR